MHELYANSRASVYRAEQNFSLSRPLAANEIEIFRRNKTQEDGRRVIILIRDDLKIIDAPVSDRLNNIIVYNSRFCIYILKFPPHIDLVNMPFLYIKFIYA